MSKYKYYVLNELLSRNKVFNFSIGTRGIGKSYGFKRWMINDYIKNKKQAIYLRRYSTEFDEIKNYFNDIEDKYPKYEFEVKGNKFYIKSINSDDWEVMGYYYALSTAYKLKSNSFPKVNKMCYDEFILEKGLTPYLANEVNVFLNFYETVDRTREEVRVLFIGNAITIMNPYFLYWNIKIDTNKRFSTWHEEIVVDYLIDKEFIEQKRKSKIGRLTNDTDFFKTSYENEFVRDNYDFIEGLSKKAKHQITIRHNKMDIGLWVDFETNTVYASSKINHDMLKFALLNSDLKEGYKILSSNTHYKKFLREAYEKGVLRYENLKIKNFMEGVLKILYIAK